MERIIAAIIGATATVVAAVLKVMHSGDDESDNVDLNLTDHPIFPRIDYIKSKMNFEGRFKHNKARAQLCKDVVSAYMDIIKDNLYEMAEEVEKREKREEDYSIYDLTLEYINRINSDYKCTANYDLNLELKDNRAVLNKFINEFNDKNIRIMDEIKDKSLSISESDFYTSNRVKTAIIFDKYIGELNNLVEEGAEVLMGIDGDIDGLLYKGEEIHPFEGEED